MFSSTTLLVIKIFLSLLIFVSDVKRILIYFFLGNKVFQCFFLLIRCAIFSHTLNSSMYVSGF
jgi:hypothetical protein